MFSILTKAFSFVFIIALAYALKRIGLFGPKDYSVVVKLVLNVTLPAAVICNFAVTPLDTSMLLLALIGFLANCLMLGVGLLLGRGKDRGLRALYALSCPGYNIGAFSMPFAQGFLGASGVAAACIFDTGNAIMCTGGSYAITDTLLSPGKQGSALKALGKKLLSSTPFLTYTLMLVLGLFHISIPMGLANFVRPIADANAYCAMFMIGLMFELNLTPEIFRSVGIIVLVRNVAAIALAAVFYFLLPLPLAMRQALVVIAFAPPSAITAAFTERCGGDGAAASCAASCCILTALIGMTTALVLMNP